MKLWEFTSETNEDGSRIVRVSGRVSTHYDLGEQTGSITFQLEIDEPTNLNGALLRAEALSKAQNILDQLASDFLRLGDKFRS